MALGRFPDPPAQSNIRVDERDGTVVISYAPKLITTRGAASAARAAGCFFSMWNGMLLLFAGFGGFMLFMLVKDVIAGKAAPAMLIGALVFFGVWYSMLTLFFVMGRRVRGAATGQVNLFGWKLELSPHEWRCQNSGLLRARRSRLDPREIQAIRINRQRRVVAETMGGDVVLTTPLQAFQAEWLRSALSEAVGLRGPAPTAAFPFVPDGEWATPGTKLTYRLPSTGSAAATAMGCFIFAVIWNAITSVFVVFAVQNHLKGRPEWFLTLFLIPFVLVGIAAIIGFVHQLLVATGVGPTTAEISAHPLHPGERCQVYVTQAGNLTMNSLRVQFVCEESVTYRHGTSTRTDTKRVQAIELYRAEGFEVHKGLPYEVNCQLAVPERAMHTFEASNNRINWKLVVDGDVAGWPNFTREYPIFVYPAEHPEAS